MKTNALAKRGNSKSQILDGVTVALDMLGRYACGLGIVYGTIIHRPFNSWLFACVDVSIPAGLFLMNSIFVFVYVPMRLHVPFD